MQQSLFTHECSFIDRNGIKQQCCLPSIEDFNTLTNEVNCLNKENNLLNTLINIYNTKRIEDISSIHHNISIIKETINASNVVSDELEQYIKQCSKDNKKSYMKHIDAVEIHMIDEIDNIKRMITEMRVQFDKQFIDINNQIKTMDTNYNSFINDINKIIDEPEIKPISKPVTVSVKKSVWYNILCRGDTTNIGTTQE